MKTYFLIAVLLLAGFTTTLAQRHDNRANNNDRIHPLPPTTQLDSRDDRAFVAQFNQKQREARARIARGIENGALTPNEAIRLLDEYQRIEIREQRPAD